MKNGKNLDRKLERKAKLAISKKDGLKNTNLEFYDKRKHIELDIGRARRGSG